MLESIVNILKRALGFIKLAALYLPKLIGLLENKPDSVEEKAPPAPEDAAPAAEDKEQ